MKLYAVINTEGDILAAVNLDEKSVVSAQPVADEKAGHKAVEVPAPAEQAHYDLATLCQRLKVDDKGKFPTLKAKE